MEKLIENTFKFWFSAFSFYTPTMKKKTPKVTPENARFKVTQRKVKESVFFSNAPTKEQAEKEAWRQFNIYSDKVQSSQHVPFFLVEENPHKTIDDDGYDVVTGIRKEVKD